MAENGAGREEGQGSGVLLYYTYAPVPDLPSLVRFYDSNCRSLGLIGRVRIAPDGVNVTVGGKMSSLEKHIAEVKSKSLFERTDFKLAACEHPSDKRIAKECGFTSLNIRVVKEHTFLQWSSILFSMMQKQLVLLDARNMYETRIGKFQTPNVETLDPETRQYSDLPAWIDDNSEQLRGKHVLMYCTGGIRCEMASAYIRSKGVGFENVFQLFGGIQRYLEQFPDGGFFKGKKFVFDHRISVGSQDVDIVGNCLICRSSFDDYSSRCRCSYCRMLVLVCYNCQGKAGVVYVCELCQKQGKGDKPLLLIQDNQINADFLPDSSEAIEIAKGPFSGHIKPLSELSVRDGNNHRRKLRILCLHGFRQNASNFKGRTSSLAKKLKNMVEFVFVDAPHELPFIYQEHSHQPPHVSMDWASEEATNLAHSFKESPPPLKDCKKRFAWLIAPKSDCLEEGGWKIADVPFDPLQYQQQTDGFEKSYSYLKTVISQMGPFDGILGFSQGAAMAALFCEQQQRCGGVLDFRFAILCSGFSAVSGECSRKLIKCPSLHCFGNGQGHDRQIACEASRKLVDLFDKDCSVVIEHDMGHIIPTRSPYIDQMKEFLMRFL
ncbi:rhodanese-like domain-containing protein 6 isoform X2 [Elaeis guineensis]|uniref:Rhodanese-like domain-containing protein 6 isoform X2 n=1 Tax=Elaeis guineensis var. tenera TaxID=51953 RepID=A0A6J0PES4_ELAGV|nr:rhodanese-like domain-containing protein 6 isoform X2 [Elaeis guineensis]